MSGDAFIRFEDMMMCPCCGRRAFLDYVEVNQMEEHYAGAVELVLKFRHNDDQYKDESWHCDPQEESGGYFITIPMVTSSMLAKVTDDELTRKLLEVEAKHESTENLTTIARWY